MSSVVSRYKIFLKPKFSLFKSNKEMAMYPNITRAAFNKTLFNKNHSSVIPILNSISNRNIIWRNVSQNLPRLPIPTLKQTIDKFLLTVKPHLNDQELHKTTEVVKKFIAEDGIGSKLQDLLVKKAQTSENWLADWWLNAAYLDFRSSVVVYSSPGLVFPFVQFNNRCDRLQYTAKLIAAAVDYKLLIDNDKIPTDMMGKDPLDMNQYKRVFGTCRIPGLSRDGLEFHPQSKHIVIVCNNNYFKVDVLGSNGEALSISQLLEQCEYIMENSRSKGAPIGILTTEHRDLWGASYQILMQDETNRKSVKDIQSALFLVCIDGPMTKIKNLNKQTVASEQLIHGGGSTLNSANRWYDKTIQFIIGEDGTNGLTYEHSPSEGQPIAVMTDYLVDYINKGTENCTQNTSFEGKPQLLNFNVSPELKKAISIAEINLDNLAKDLDMCSFTFKSFGKDFVKSQKLSPDSFIQIAMQYAFYRLHKVPGAHYESAATRKYIHGRTETIRSCSIESVAFARAMLDNSTSDEDKVKALKAAVASHKKYTVEALNGFGVDRHLLGLKLMALEKNMEISPLYKDAGYVKSAHMRISSSQVATNCDGFMCYGPLVPDGYGCCYNPRKNDINIAVSAFTSHSETKASKFAEAMQDSLMDMHNILLKVQKSKL